MSKMDWNGYLDVVAGPATPETDRKAKERAELEAWIRRIVRDELASSRPTTNEGEIR
jgi:hypothetical protein